MNKIRLDTNEDKGCPKKGLEKGVKPALRCTTN
jgi:hypothetical protein